MPGVVGPWGADPRVILHLYHARNTWYTVLSLYIRYILCWYSCEKSSIYKCKNSCRRSFSKQTWTSLSVVPISRPLPIGLWYSRSTNIYLRWNLVFSKRLCFNSFGEDCYSQKTCQMCNRQHHTKIHDSIMYCSPHSPEMSRTSRSQLKPLRRKDSHRSHLSATVNHAAMKHGYQQSNVLLATAQVLVVGTKRRLYFD